MSALLARGFDGSAPRRTAIPDDVKQFVFTRDGGRCVGCGADTGLQFDHVIPISPGDRARPRTSNCSAAHATEVRVPD